VVFIISFLGHYVPEDVFAFQASNQQALENFSFGPGLSDGILAVATQFFGDFLSPAHTLFGDVEVVHANDRHRGLASGLGVAATNATAHDALFAP
jgi:hypothetical protein